jgi:nickel-dependent lactate racemase
MAYGLHRPMNASQLEHRLGREVVDRFAVMHHDAYQGGGLSLKGTTSSGIPVFLNSSLDDADVTIGIGNISLSKEAGYGGGAKILMPGVAGEETIYRSHAKVREHPNQIGRLQGNPIRQDIEESGRLGKLSFIINTVLNEQDAVCRLVSGHPEIAFKLGVGEFNQIYEVPVHGAFDLLVVSSSPMDTDFYQANKAISASSLGVRDGGTIVMVSPCLNGVSSFPYFDEMITSGRTYGEWQETIAEPDFRHKVAAEICLSLRYLQDVRKIRIGMVTPGIPHETVAKMGILPYVSVEAAVRDAQDRYGNGLRLGFVPKAPLTLLSPLGF